jgi:hypothetical protein
MRLDTERQERLEPKRVAYARQRIEALGYEVEVIGKSVRFEYKGSVVIFWPYTGWASGKAINDGRGINNLLKQIEVET